MSQSTSTLLCIRLHGYIHLFTRNYYCCTCYTIIYHSFIQRYFLPLDQHTISIAPHMPPTICSRCRNPMSIQRPITDCNLCSGHIHELFSATPLTNKRNGPSS